MCLHTTAVVHTVHIRSYPYQKQSIPGLLFACCFSGVACFRRVCVFGPLVALVALVALVGWGLTLLPFMHMFAPVVPVFIGKKREKKENEKMKTMQGSGKSANKAKIKPSLYYCASIMFSST